MGGMESGRPNAQSCSALISRPWRSAARPSGWVAQRSVAPLRARRRSRRNSAGASSRRVFARTICRRSRLKLADRYAIKAAANYHYCARRASKNFSAWPSTASVPNSSCSLGTKSAAAAKTKASKSRWQPIARIRAKRIWSKSWRDCRAMSIFNVLPPYAAASKAIINS